MKDFITLATVCLALAALPCAKLLGAEEQSSPATSEVVARGVGVDPDKALKDALMIAVQQVVGLVLDAETLVKDEALVKEQILTHSDGFVNTFQKLKEGKRDDGLFEVTINASVKRRQIVEKLKESKVSITKIDGQSLFAEITTQHEAAKSGAEFLEKALEGLPVNVLVASVLNSKPIILKETDSSVQAAWNLEVRFDWADYEVKILPQLKRALESAAKRKGNAEIPDQADSNNYLFTPTRRRPFWFEDRDNRAPGAYGYARSSDTFFVNTVNEIPIDTQKEFLFLLNVGRTEDLRLRRWVWYVLDRDTTAPVLNKQNFKKLSLRISFVDSDKQPVRQNDIVLNNASSARFAAAYSGHPPGQLVEITPEQEGLKVADDWFIANCWRVRNPLNTFTIAPYIRIGKGNDLRELYGDALQFSYVTEFTLADLKRINEIRCSVLALPTTQK